MKDKYRKKVGNKHYLLKLQDNGKLEWVEINLGYETRREVVERLQQSTTKNNGTSISSCTQGMS